MSQTTPKAKQVNLFSFFKKTPKTDTPSKNDGNSILSPKRSPNAIKSGKDKSNKQGGYFFNEISLLEFHSSIILSSREWDIIGFICYS